MARTQARMLVRVWTDEDFKALSRQVQGTYWFLVSQANLNHAGLLPLTVKRWSQTAGGCTVEEVEADLKVLEDADYVVIDRETEELLIRTLVRNDGVWKQPKVMQAMKADSTEIVSPLLRWRLREELLKIDVTELEKEATRNEVATVISQTLETLPDTPPQGYAIPLATAIGYTHAGAGAHSSASASTTTSASSTSTGLMPCDEPPEDPTSELLIEHIQAYAEPPTPDTTLLVKQQIMRQVAQGVPAERIRAGLARLRERRVNPKLLPDLITECSPVERPSTTDRAVATGVGLVAKYREREAG